MASNNQPWPKEQEERLVQLFNYKQDGVYYLSHTYVAMMMQSDYPHLGHGAIISKLKRLKLTRDPTVKYISANGVVIDPTITDFSGKMKIEQYGRNNGKKVTPRERETAGEFNGTYSVYACQVAELSDKRCHFPIGHVGHEGFHFCGSEVKFGSYCAEHAALCHAPKQQRVEVRPAYRPTR